MAIPFAGPLRPLLRTHGGALAPDRGLSRRPSAPDRSTRPRLEALDRRTLLSVGSGAVATGPHASAPVAVAGSGDADLLLVRPPRVNSVALQPRLGRLLITYRDTLPTIDPATLFDPANIALVRIRTPRFPSLNITGAMTSPLVDPKTVAFTFDNGTPLPRGQYLLTIRSGGVRNVAGAALDGEFRGVLPSGNGIPGGTFRAVLRVGTDGTFSGLPRPLGGFFTPPNRPPTPFGRRDRTFAF
jgi:hypothetical protein